MPSSRASDAAEERTDVPRGQHEHDHQEQPQQEGRDVAALSDELARSEERYKRALADLDNYRKRAGREVERYRVEIRDELSRDWLEVVDSVDRALRLGPDDGPHAEGLRAVLEQIEAVLARHGVRRIGTRGERFDPERHEVISVQDTDAVDDQTVLEVARSGFAIGDRVLRPAQVVVSRRPQAEV
jgi:molecular chaperone GrpE